MIEKSITIDFFKEYRGNIEITQYDADSVIFHFTLVGGSKPIDLTACDVVFYAKKPDDTILFNNCVITDAETGKADYTVTGQTAAVAGELECWIVIVEATPKTVRSQKFTVTVTPSDDDTGAIESTSEFTALEEALALTTGFDARITQNENDITTLESEKTGWISAGETWTYDSTDDPTGVITISGDVHEKYTVGTRVKFTNGGNTIYGIVSKNATYSSPDTTVTFLHEINPADNEALHLMIDDSITNPYYSRAKVPQGFPAEIAKWSVILINLNSVGQSSPTANTWYNMGGLYLDVPIGVWGISYSAIGQIDEMVSGSAAYRTMSTTLSSNSSTESDSYKTTVIGGYSTAPTAFYGVMTNQKNNELTSKVRLYLLAKTGSTAYSALHWRGDLGNTVIRAVSELL